MKVGAHKIDQRPKSSVLWGAGATPLPHGLCEAKSSALHLFRLSQTGGATKPLPHHERDKCRKGCMRNQDKEEE